MAQPDVTAIPLICCALLVAGLAAREVEPQSQQSNAGSRAAAVSTVPLHPTRVSPSDLEVTGMIPGVQSGTVRYVKYADLASLPKVTTTMADSPDPSIGSLHSMRITGVSLEVLARALGVPPSSDLIDALCADRYRSHYPAGYIASHHPFLVLKINGVSPSTWAAHADKEDPGPYFITYDRFIPAFQVLSHKDEAQLPTNITRLNFTTASATFRAIAPPDNYPTGSPVQAGFTIAKQNCLRCHSRGLYGGTKSGLDWNTLSTWAREQPAYFARYVHNPKAVEPHARMPSNPDYDDATLAALTAYFRTFTAESRHHAAHGN
jgi:mono/diheme cytochrome c family protein